MNINPYLNFNGNTEEAFEFYRSVFGGEFVGGGIMRFKDMPGCDEGSGPSEAELEKVMHVCLPIGEGHYLMGTDSLESMGQKVTMGDNFSINVSPGSKDDADRLFSGLGDGGTVIMPMQDMFWGAYWGLLKDKFGVQWMVNYMPAPCDDEKESNNEQ
jgi:PhnB protein